MAKRKYLELKDVRAHYDDSKERIILTSSSPAMRRSGFQVTLEPNTRTELSVKNRMRKAGLLAAYDPSGAVHWNDDNVLVVAGKAGIGKTSFAVILSSALSAVGKRVLLVDTVRGEEKLLRYTPHRQGDGLSTAEGYQILSTKHGWDVLLKPQREHMRLLARGETSRVHEYLDSLKASYDVLIFDTSEDFLAKREYSPYLRYFSNILLLTHPYRGSAELAENFSKGLPSSIALNSLITEPEVRNFKLHNARVFGCWSHMREFYSLDSDSLLMRGKPLAHMHDTILPHLPLSFRP